MENQWDLMVLKGWQLSSEGGGVGGSWAGEALDRPWSTRGGTDNISCYATKAKGSNPQNKECIGIRNSEFGTWDVEFLES